MYKFIDLFAGIGGFRVALENLGNECVFSCEINKYTRAVYQENFNDDVHVDIRKIKVSSIPKHDILCGGFPCQSFSINGHGKGFDDDRGMLFYDMLRIIEYHKPLILLLENVRNIMAVDSGEVFNTIVNSLKNLGYHVHYSLLNSGDYGIPQHRVRVYFVCLRKDSGLKYFHPLPDRKDIFLRDILDDVTVDNQSLNYKKTDNITLNIKYEPYCSHKLIKIGQVGKGFQSDRIYHPNGYAKTLLSNASGIQGLTGLYIIDGKLRSLSISECKRTMRFDNLHIVSDGYCEFEVIEN